MKFRRGKNIITIEIEPLDAPKGYDLEMYADTIMAGMMVSQNIDIRERLIAVIRQDEKINEAIKNVRTEQDRKWEIL
jgi:hypothetical protein